MFPKTALAQAAEEEADTIPPDTTVWNLDAKKYIESECYQDGGEDDPTSICLTWDVRVDPDEHQGKEVKSTGIKGCKIYYGKKSVQEGKK